MMPDFGVFVGDRPCILVGGDHPYQQWLNGQLPAYEWAGLKPYMAVNTNADANTINPGQTDMPPWVQRMLALALITGQRRGDLVKMRFADVWDDHLHIEQAKTGTRIALPLALHMDAIDLTLREVIEDCRAYAAGSEFLLRKHDGCQLGAASLSARFEIAREGALDPVEHPPSLHECRSLSERLYRKQGLNTMTLLGHKHQKMTDMYNDDRGLTRGEWKVLAL